MEQNKNCLTPEAATDEPASSPQPLARDNAVEPLRDAVPDDGSWYDNEPQEEAFWKGVCHGIRCAGDTSPADDHMRGSEFAARLTRDGASPGLVSTRLEVSPSTAAASNGRAVRHDGWTPERQRAFLDALAACGVVADACRVVGMGRDSAYDLRKRAEGRAFALAWDAAVLIARGRIGDELFSRAMHGCVDRVYKEGELVAERHRHDNRLAMAVLTRLDRQAEGLGEGAATARAIAQEFDQFLDIVGNAGEGAQEFLAARAPAAENTLQASKKIESDSSLLARLTAYRKYEAGLAHEIKTSDLDPAGMEEWSDEQWSRAEFSGLLDRLPESAWPDAARVEAEGDDEGNCRVRRFYRDRRRSDEEDDGFELWEDENGEWRTDYPPPKGFDGARDGEFGDDDYSRALSPAEQAVTEAEIAAEANAEAEELAAELADASAARDRRFGFAGG